MSTQRNDTKKPQANQPAEPAESPPRAGIQWRAVVFAFAGNLLLFTLANAVALGLVLNPASVLWVSLTGPVLAGVLTAFLAQRRGGIHAFIGGIASLPIIALFILPGDWPAAIFAACFCTLGGAITEIVIRNRT